MKILIPIGLIFGYILAGCSGGPAPAPLNPVDSMLQRASYLDQSLKTFPLDSARMIFHDSRTFNDFFKQFSDQRMLFRKNIELQGSGIVQKFLGKFINKVPGLSEELSLSIKQLSALKHDLDRGQVADSLIPEYIQDEKMAFDKVNKSLSEELEFARLRMQYFRQIRPALDHLRDSLRNSTGAK